MPFRLSRVAKASAIAAVLATALLLVPLAQGLPEDVPDDTWSPNGRVNAILQLGNVVFLGGNFTEVREDGGAGSATLPRSYIAAFDATTGAPIQGWDPVLNGEVFALAASPDGTKVYAGGAFTTVDGLTRSRVVGLNVATGAPDSQWKPKAPNGSVRALAVGWNRVYAGGGFTKVGVELRTRLAALDTATGALDPTWQPTADGMVYTLAASTAANRIYAGGDFNNASGVSRQDAAAFDRTSGALATNWHPDPDNRVFGLAVRDDTVYGAVGGGANSLFAWDAGTAAQRWRKTSDGDFQALAVSRGIVYAGGHFNKFEGEARRKLVAVDAATGALRRDWHPKLPHTSATWYGISALSTYGDTRLAVGGDFDTVSGFRQEHYAQFTGPIAGTIGDTTPPTQPAGVTATAMGGSRVELAWSASTDDDGIAEYRVFRGGVQIATTSLPLFTDRSVTPSTGYSYHVVAVDFAGNASPASAQAPTTTAAPDDVRTFIATEDAYIDATTPTTTSGSSSSLRVDSDPKRDFLVKFAPTGIQGRRILSAKLRLYNTDESNNGGDFRRVSDNSWSESTLNWANAPAGDPYVVSTLDDVFAGSWYDVDVTPVVTGDGQVSFRASSPSSNGAAFASSEGSSSLRPQLVVTLAAEGATVPAWPAFRDGFETGDLSRWTEDTGLAVRADQPFSGSWAAHAASTGQAAYAFKDLRVTEPELFYRLRFKVIDRGAGTVSLLKFRDAAGAPLMRLFLSTGGKLATRNDVTGIATTSATGIATGRWYTAQMRTRVGAAGAAEVWLDGTRIDDLSRTEALGTTPIARVELGDDGIGKTYDVRYDEVTVDTQLVGDTVAPTAPTGLSAVAPSSDRVELAWSPAADDVAVTEYQIHRDGDLLATVGAVTAYTDNAVSPGTSYEYVVRANDGAGNRSPASAPATATTPTLDTTPPSAPAATATAISFDRVDLSWTASTDNRAVTDYRILRDGDPLATVGSQTRSFSDRSVAPAAGYDYAVQALDAAGNVSDPSPEATATTPARTVFLDGFESGDLSQWTSGAGIVVEQGGAFAGSFAAHATTASSARYRYKQLGSAHGELHYRLRFKLLSQVDSFSLLKLRTAAGSQLVRLWLSSTGKLSTRNDLTGVSTTSTTQIVAGRWYAAKVGVVVDGAASRVDVWLDGDKVTSLSKAESLGTTPIGRVQLGDDASGKAYDVVFDDVAVDSPPANAAAPTIAGTLRDGDTLSADRGSWSGTEPIDYAYQWRRCDGSGNGCADIAGATEQSYTLVAADVGSTIRLQVLASNTVRSVSAASAASAAVAAIEPASTAAPTIAGSAIDGETLTADRGSWSGSEPIDHAYQWRRCDGSGEGCADIAGATEQSYQLTSSDVGSTVRVQVTGSNAGGAASAGSAASGAVLAAAPLNTVTPTIAGTLEDGGTLSADRGSWSGTGPIDYAYQWSRCDGSDDGCAEVAGATELTYVLTAADVGSTIRIKVTASNAVGSAIAGSAASATVAAAPPINTADPTIAGTPRDGETLTADNGSWSGTAQIDYAYQWRRCDGFGDGCADILGATEQAYELAAADVGSTIRVQVTASNAGGSASVGSDASAAVAAIAPTSASTPTISGTARDGETLDADPGSWSGSEPIAYAYQWRRCDGSGDGCVDVIGATEQAYELTAADVGSTIRVQVTASNAGGSASAGSAASGGVLAAPPANGAAPTISGTLEDGQTLTADRGSWSGTDPIDYAYQWRRCDGSGAGCADVADATEQSYVLTAADIGSTMRVQVTASNTVATAGVHSSATGSVAAAAPINTAEATVAGTLRDGETLSADRGSWSGTAPIDYAYQWRRCDAAGAGCADIAGATEQSHTLGAADVGSTIRVRVTASNAGGSQSAVSAAGDSVAAIAPTSTAPPSLSGSVQDGQTLSADPGSWSGTAPIDYANQWRRCDADGAGCADIAGATEPAYELAAADIGSTIRVKVAASNAGGSASADSAASGGVLAAPPANSAAPTISGTLEDSGTLSADRGSWSGTQPIDYAYQWQRCGLGLCHDVLGATAQSYTLTGADVGSTVRLQVTAANAAGQASADSEQTAVVSPAPARTVFLDGFESGDLSQWTSGAGMVVQQGGAFAGSFAARATTTSSARYRYKQLGSAHRELHYRLRFKLVSQADTFSLLKLRTAAGSPLARLWLSSTGKLSTRNDVTGVATTSTTQIVAGRWYAARVGVVVDGAASRIDVWLDDVKVTSLSKAESLGTTPIGRIQLGDDASGKAYDVVFDDVAVDAPPASIGSPTIAGTLRDGETLTADRGAWSGTTPIDYAYQWRRCDAVGASCSAITGATGQAYELTADDIGSTVRVQVTASNAAGAASAGSAASGGVLAAPPANGAAPTISGTLEDGQTLTADRGSWSGTDPIDYAYQWRRCDGSGAGCADVADATEQSYVLTAADIGSTMRVQVTASNTVATAGVDSSATGPVGAVAVASTGQPTISGAARDGEILTADPGVWSGTAPISYDYQWRRCDSAGASCSDIAGAVGQSYELSAADVDSMIRVKVTASNTVGSAGATSEPTDVVVATAPASSSAPTVSGTAADAETLTADRGSWSGTGPIDYAYQWRRCDGAGDGCADILGATEQAYELGVADVGFTVRLQVTASNAGGSSSAGSEPTASVAAAPPVNDAAPTISGTLEDGHTLTADRGSWSGTDPIDYAYQWSRCDGAGDGCVDIAGATAPSYELTDADVGSTIRVRLSASNAAGSAIAGSAASAAVSAAPPIDLAEPTVSGTLRDGETLTADRGSWSGTGPIDYAYQWRRCDGAGDGCADIAGATEQSYTLGAADVGSTIRMQITASNAGGSASAVSAASAAVDAIAPMSSSSPTISGTSRDGETLNADPGVWSGTQPIAYDYQWRRCDNSGDGCEDVPGAADQSYTLTSADVGSTLRVRVGAANGAGSAGADSEPTGAVAAVAPANTLAPTIAGTAQAGQTLGADPGAWSGTGPLAYAYQWQRCGLGACSDILGASAESYDLTPADVDFTIRLQVTASNAAGQAAQSSQETPAVLP